MLPGEPLSDGGTALGRDLGAFLKALHAVDPAEAVAHGARDAEAAYADKARFLAECRKQVVPLLPPDLHGSAHQLLDRVAEVRTCLVHCDFGPEHILTTGGRITGIIDWTDAEIGDPALDLCWLLHSAPDELAAGAAETYDITPELRSRARDWACLSPWYGVHRGLLLDIPEDAERGLREITARL
jgi:aminoglycoside phosphotransferase (APT) family kinase protein